MSYSLISDAVYLPCAADPSAEVCGVCKSSIFSSVVNAEVSDSGRGKVFCPFGKNPNNQNIFSDQEMIYANLKREGKPVMGVIPQLNPRSNARIGLEWHH